MINNTESILNFFQRNALNILFCLLFSGFGLYLFSIIASSGPKAPYLDASQMALTWALPFVGVLGSLALMPLFQPHLWHNHYGKIVFCWAMMIVIPMAMIYGPTVALYEVLHTYLLHYIPFIIVPFTLYTIAGGIKLRLNCRSTPLSNTVFLLLATLTSSWVGTTGAAMLFIKAFLNCNKDRTHKVHLVIFFIILICNIGGALSALGDPPLFLGFLHGIDFFWPALHLFQPFLVVTVPTLILFYSVDFLYYRREMPLSTNKKENPPILKSIQLEGGFNFLLLLGVILAVLMSGLWQPETYISVFFVKVQLQNLVRDIILLSIAAISWGLTPKKIRYENAFSWEPIKEVAKIFAAIFIVAAPVISILGQGEKGALGALVAVVNEEGVPQNGLYFWMTGLLSAFLDNAPTYLVFFYVAGGNPDFLMSEGNTTLIAISAGAVFMGALTYIGNAPNFMVKSIAEIHRIKMPSFFAYSFWVCLILLPSFALLHYLFL